MALDQAKQSLKSQGGTTTRTLGSVHERGQGTESAALIGCRHDKHEPTRRRADMVPVLFKGGPLHRQVHVWAKTDAESTEIVRMYHDDGSGLYIRSRRWRSLLNTHRALIYAWKAETEPSAAREPREGVAPSDPDL